MQALYARERAFLFIRAMVKEGRRSGRILVFPELFHGFATDLQTWLTEASRPWWRRYF